MGTRGELPDGVISPSEYATREMRKVAEERSRPTGSPNPAPQPVSDDTVKIPLLLKDTTGRIYKPDYPRHHPGRPVMVKPSLPPVGRVYRHRSKRESIWPYIWFLLGTWIALAATVVVANAWTVSQVCKP